MVALVFLSMAFLIWLHNTHEARDTFAHQVQTMWFYAFGLLFYQGMTENGLKSIERYIILYINVCAGGFYFKRKKLEVLLVVGSWSLCAFLVVNYYNSLLISDVTAPQRQPLIRSIYEFPRRDDLRLVTDRKGNTNFFISVLIA